MGFGREYGDYYQDRWDRDEVFRDNMIALGGTRDDPPPKWTTDDIDPNYIGTEQEVFEIPDSDESDDRGMPPRARTRRGNVAPAAPAAPATPAAPAGAEAPRGGKDKGKGKGAPSPFHQKGKGRGTDKGKGKGKGKYERPGKGKGKYEDAYTLNYGYAHPSDVPRYPGAEPKASPPSTTRRVWAPASTRMDW